MTPFEKVLSDLKSLKIQGAEAVARESVKALDHVMHNSKAIHSRELIKELNSAKDKLIATRPTEPCMRNALMHIISGLSPLEDLITLTKKVDERVDFNLEHFRNAESQIKKFGSAKIKNGTVVFTHCHSSTVINILVEAKKAGRNFEVHNTETRPLFQGRKTATELSSAGIKVSHYVDSAARLAIKKADICLFGVDAIQSDGSIINKIGTELFCEVANRYEIPIYFCSDSWKFDPKSVYGIDEPIENRNAKEIWDSAPRRVCIQNPAFEKVDANKPTGIISELGVFRPEVFVEEVRRAYPWLI
jgi:ribose 1,5-bisphosphate isomerase